MTTNQHSDEYRQWAQQALNSADADTYRSGDLDGRVLARMAAFCEICCTHFVPKQGNVTWFKKKARGGHSACKACLDKMHADGVEVPEISKMD